MREQIILKAGELFLTLGFKSVTMDDIAQEMGISKKTIYVHFENKTKLVEATTLYLFEFISCGIDKICDTQNNPIEEIYDIRQFVMEHLKDEKSSPHYQLQKYYPKIARTLNSRQFEKMQTCVVDNLNRGIAMGLYRPTMDVNFISRIYFNSMMAIKDNDLFPKAEFSVHKLMDNYLEYHLRGICTPQGLEYLKKFITSNQS